MARSRFKENTGAGTYVSNPGVREQGLIPHLRDRGPGMLLFFLALGLAGLFPGACAAPKEGQFPAAKEAAPIPAPGLKTSPSHLLPSLQVEEDSCYAFLRPDENSSHFGPLVKGERLRWLDAQGSWTRVWIPRLRVSGWVRSALVSEASEKEAGSESVPANLMSYVTVIVRKANIREGPTTQSQTIRIAKRNQQFWLLKEEGGWYQIWLPDLSTKGWISGKIVARLRQE
jgi:hypothetical protein